MVSDPSTDVFIHWNFEGTSFIVTSQEDFTQNVLPRYFKSQHFTSFIRQLNMYGFHKIPSIEQGHPEALEFSNENFIRGRPDLLCLVVRRKPNNDEPKEANNIDMSGIISEIQAIKRHQMNISQDLAKMQQDNLTIWHESQQLRDKYQHQQDTINKILEFLASVYSGKKKVGATKKRKLIREDENEDSVMETEEQMRFEELLASPLTDNTNHIPINYDGDINRLIHSTTPLANDLELLDDRLYGIANEMGIETGELWGGSSGFDTQLNVNQELTQSELDEFFKT